MRLRIIAATSACATALLLTLGGPAQAAAPSEQDAAFLRAAHQSNLAEIATGQQAQQKASSQVVKDLGARFVADHTRLDAAVTDAAATLGVSLPDAPNPEQQAAAARLDAASGQEYDALWISIQLDAHMKAMANGEKEIAQGSDPLAVQVARDAAPVIAAHHHALEEAARELGVPTRVDTGTGGQVAGSVSARAVPLALLALGMLLLVAGRRALRSSASR
jgi:putative membrane protein